MTQRLVDVISIVGKLREAYSQLLDIFKPVKNQRDNEEYEILLENEELRHDFYNSLSAFGKYMGIALESEQVYNALGDDEINRYKRELKFFQELRGSVKLRYSDAIDHKEYEPKMRNLMDNYIAAENVYKITAPVDILNEEKFEYEVGQLVSSRARADAIRTRMTKRISEKYEENPAYYKKFSERIQEILDSYKEKRISDGEYFDRLNQVKNDFRQGYSGTSFPRIIKNHPHAQAFFGVVKDEFDKISDIVSKFDSEDYEDILGELSIKIEEVIDKNSKVDWHDNQEVHNKISRDLNELFYEYKKKYFTGLTYAKIDAVIADLKTVALRRY